MKSKKERQKRILYLIEKQKFSTQEELKDELFREGFDVTQTTISRDLKELNLNKLHGSDGHSGYASINKDEWNLDDKYRRVLKEGLISMDDAMNILVIHTVAGMAMAVAAAIDSLKLPKVVGTIAGDDTIMLVIKTVPDTRNVMGIIKSHLEDL